MEERRRRIVELVNTMGNVSFAQLKERFSDVSEMTLRTDLKYLDETHQILRVYGGAKSVYSVIGSDEDVYKRQAVRYPLSRGSENVQQCGQYKMCIRDRAV